MSTTELMQARAHAHTTQTELARLKAERDELREALRELLRADERPPTMRQASDAQLAMAKARAVLKRTEGKP